MDMSPWVEVVLAVGGLSGVAALINSLSKASTDRVDQLVNIIDAQAERLGDLECEITKLEAVIARWRKRYYALVRWIEDQGMEPPDCTK